MLALLIMHGSILLVTMHPGYTAGNCNFFLFWRSIPHPRARRRKQFTTPELPMDFIYVFCKHLFDPYKSKTTRFHYFYERFPGFIDSTVIDVIM